MESIELKVNGESHSLQVAPDMPLLWAIRDFIGLKGTKYGCGIGQCGSCMVLLAGKPVRACTMPVSAVNDREVVTIEGLSSDNDHPVQRAFIEAQAPQCGYCYSGQVLAAAVLLKDNPRPTDREIEKAMDGVICRCGTYPRVKTAIRRAIEIINQS
ncbi:MAG: (2Fe-2S)-binding protein [Cyclobacteriaceae bacterium]|nr:(2Fe-2S)-binding protein [Cyclobacteriaceae bacterium]